MGEITNDAAIMAALGRHMTRAVQRQSVAAGQLVDGDGHAVGRGGGLQR